MPCYAWAPMGGFRVTFEYANSLVARGHEVTVVHPRRLKDPGYLPEESAWRWTLNKMFNIFEVFLKPTISWLEVDKRVRLEYVPSSDARHIPDGDALIATSWTAVRSVLECPPSKGEKFNLIQGYGPWMGPKELIDRTWCAPIHKIVVSRWLLEISKELGLEEVVYIPNGINHQRYRVTQAIEDRPRQAAMLYSTVDSKGSADGFEALRIAREKFPELKIIAFGTSRRRGWVPDWVEYHRNPAQDFIVNEIYNQSQIFVSPSWSEGFGLPPAEAAACGCAIVATDSGGIRDFVEHGVTGLLSPPKDPAALATILCAVLENEKLRVRLAKACNKSVASLTWERSTDLLEDFLTRLTKKRLDLARVPS